ncbi:hypothetical protein [Eoetvoesiella caeni]|uniref:Uncharacterized protein n=1 Tax=Eoetvoesiella caeni TaxID=645616 RepID=A0A366HE21_9BURK|nr:hypothetical protein [Eoetvoesiella caeni]MCI2808928.1 hypothetical protein [Eoetvoesiella caeni]NYT55571.1 hypothetical protein [Eoetvoesiella caeni]RBP40126.1 hypothetical protein DFR37_104223 [Eoetvoesiella caeni]
MNQEQGPSGLYQSISTLAGVIAFAVMLMGTPIVFEMTYRPLFSYFLKFWSRDLAESLVWVMGAVEACLIFMATSFLLTAGMVWIVTQLAMRRFKD